MSDNDRVIYALMGTTMFVFICIFVNVVYTLMTNTIY